MIIYSPCSLLKCECFQVACCYYYCCTVCYWVCCVHCTCCNRIYAFEKGMMWTQKERNLISLEGKQNILLDTDTAMCMCISLVKQFGFWVTTLNIIVKRLSCLEDNDNKCGQPSAQWLLRLFPLGKNRWGMKQTTHLHLQPRYRMQGTTLSTPSCA